ncbi:MAG: helix-turn-helix domain-containing protein [Prochloraceae cyanobacterium]
MTKNARIEGKTVKVKRQDIRIPIDFYNRLKKIAVERFNAHVHHRSGEPTITPTLLKLAELGIEYLESGLADKKTEITTTEVFKRLENLESNNTDNNTDKFLKELLSRIEAIENNLNDNNADTIPNTIGDRLSALEQSLKDNNSTNKKLEDRIKVLEQQLANNIPDRVLDRVESLERQLNDSNTDNIWKELTARLERLEKNLADNNNTDIIPLKKLLEEVEEQQEINYSATELRLITNADNNIDSNTDNTWKELTARLERLEKPLADNNADIIPNQSREELELSDNYADIIPLKKLEEVEEQQEINYSAIETSAQLLTLADNNANFYTGLKELFSNSNDPDPSPTKGSDKLEPLSDNEPILENYPDITIEEKGLTDSELALKLGVNASTVNRWRTGRSKPRGLNLKHLKNWEVRGDRWLRKS